MIPAASTLTTSEGQMQGRTSKLADVDEEEDSEDEVDRQLANEEHPRSTTRLSVVSGNDGLPKQEDLGRGRGRWGWTTATTSTDNARRGWWSRRRTPIAGPEDNNSARESSSRRRDSDAHRQSRPNARGIAAAGSSNQLPLPRSRPGTPRSTSLADRLPGGRASRASSPLLFTSEQIDSAANSTKLDEMHLPMGTSSESPVDEAELESDGEGEKLCRICFTGDDDDDDDEEEEDDNHDENRDAGKRKEKDQGLGRLISPCLCRGSMRHVHISCLQQWRGKGRNKKAYMECTQCKFRYRLRRTRFLGLASSPIILLITSLVLFLALTLAVGSALHWLMRFSRFRRLVAGPTERQPRMVKLIPKKNRISRWIPFQMEDTQEEFEAAVRHDPLVPIGIELPGGFTYMQPSSGMFELVIRSMRAFINGEAQEVGEGVWQMVIDAAEHLEVYSAGHYALLPFRMLAKLAGILKLGSLMGWLHPILERFSLGFSLIGSMSFATLLITSSFMAPFQLANNVRIGRGGGPFGLPMGALGGRRRAAQARAATMQTGQLGTVGIGSLVLVMFVVMGAVRAITQLYSFTNYLAVVLLTKAENAILEVNRRGEVIEDARAITMQDGGRMVQVRE